MTTYDLTKKTNASTGQVVMPSPHEISDKLDHIVKLLNELSEKKSAS